MRFKFAPVAGTTDEIAIPGNVDVDTYRKLAINSIADWPDGTTHIDVEYIVRDRDGELLTASTNRLLRPYLIACGNSQTWGLRRRADRVLETPQWNAPWTTYPGEAEWLAKGLSPANRFLRAYQGYRGYLAEKLPGVTWLGLDTNGHGPPHLGFPGAFLLNRPRERLADETRKNDEHAKTICLAAVVFTAVLSSRGEKNMPKLRWGDDDKVRNAVSNVVMKILREDKSLSYGDSRSGNILVHGDNFEAPRRSETISTSRRRAALGVVPGRVPSRPPFSLLRKAATVSFRRHSGVEF